MFPDDVAIIATADRVCQSGRSGVAELGCAAVRSEMLKHVLCIASQSSQHTASGNSAAAANAHESIRANRYTYSALSKSICYVYLDCSLGILVYALTFLGVNIQTLQVRSFMHAIINPIVVVILLIFN